MGTNVKVELKERKEKVTFPALQLLFFLLLHVNLYPSPKKGLTTRLVEKTKKVTITDRTYSTQVARISHIPQTASYQSTSCTNRDFVPLYSNIGKAARHFLRVLLAMTVLAYGNGRGCLRQENQWPGLQTSPDSCSNNTFDHAHPSMRNGCRNSRWMDSPVQPIHTSHQRTPELLCMDKDLVDQNRSSVGCSCHLLTIVRTSSRHLLRH